MNDTKKTSRFGRVIRQIYEGDKIHFVDASGADIGFLELIRVPRDSKVSMALCFDREIKIERREEESC